MAKCRVSYTDRDGIHSVEVSAETLYEAVAQAVTDFKEDQTIPNPPGPETEFRVEVLRKPLEHFVKMKRVTEWAQFSNATSPVELLKRERVRKMLSRSELVNLHLPSRVAPSASFTSIAISSITPVWYNVSFRQACVTSGERG